MDRTPHSEKSDGIPPATSPFRTTLGGRFGTAVYRLHRYALRSRCEKCSSRCVFRFLLRLCVQRLPTRAGWIRHRPAFRYVPLGTEGDSVCEASTASGKTLAPSPQSGGVCIRDLLASDPDGILLGGKARGAPFRHEILQSGDGLVRDGLVCAGRARLRRTSHAATA